MSVRARWLAALACLAVIFAFAGSASASGPLAGIAVYGQPVCGTSWIPDDLGHGNYLNVYNASEHQGDYTCVKVPSAGAHAWGITKISNPVGWWLMPVISAGWYWGRYTCNDGPSAYPTSPGSQCMRFPVQVRSMGRVHASMRVAGDRYPQTGRYDVGWDTWFSHTAKTPVMQNDSAEIMIWPYSRNIAVNHQARAYIDYHWFWVEYWNVTRGGVTWRLTIFSLMHPLAVISNMYMDPFFSWTINHGRLSPWDYLTGIDFGTEVSAGQPVMSFSNYSLTGVR